MNTNDTSTGTDNLPVPAPQSEPALPGKAEAIFDLIKEMRAEISSASGGDALAALHAGADFYRRAAKLRDLWEFQVEFSLLVADCERALVNAYPSPTPQEAAARKGQPGEQPDLPNGITPGTLRKMRQAHDALSDAAYASLRSRSKEDGKALTRQMLHRAARAERDAGESEAKERSPMHDIDEGIRRSAGALVSRHNLPGIVVLAFTGSDEAPRCIVKAADGWVVEPCAESDPPFALRAATGGEAPPDCLQPDDQREYWFGLQDYYGERMRRQFRTPDRIDRHIDFEKAHKWARALFNRQFDYWPSDEAFPFALGIKAPSQGHAGERAPALVDLPRREPARASSGESGEGGPGCGSGRSDFVAGHLHARRAEPQLQRRSFGAFARHASRSAPFGRHHRG